MASTIQIDRLVKFVDGHDVGNGNAGTNVLAVSLDRSSLLVTIPATDGWGNVRHYADWIPATVKAAREWLGY